MRLPLAVGIFFASAICGTALASLATPACPAPPGVTLQMEGVWKNGVNVCTTCRFNGFVMSASNGDPNAVSVTVFDPDTNASRKVDLRRVP